MSEQLDWHQLVDTLPIPFQPKFNEYLKAAEQTEKWLSEFPKEMEWMLKVSPTEILEKAAESLEKEFKPTRIEDTATFGELILELVARRYTGSDAFETKEQKWGTGWNHWDEQRKQTASSSVENLIAASKESSRKLFDTLLKTKPEENIKQDMWGKEIKYSPSKILEQITNHEKRHKGMLDFFDDMLTKPGKTVDPTSREIFDSKNSDWFTDFPEAMKWVLDLRPAQVLHQASLKLNQSFVSKKQEATNSIGNIMMHRLELGSQPQTEDYFRSIYDLIQAPFPQSYKMARTTQIGSTSKT